MVSTRASKSKKNITTRKSATLKRKERTDNVPFKDPKFSPNPTQTQNELQNRGSSDSSDSSDSDSSDSSESESDSNSDSNLGSKSDPNSNPIGFNLDNFESQLSSWSIADLRKTLQKKKNPANRISQDVQEALELLQQNYIKSKLMLALIGNVGENTVNKFLGENKPSRQKCGWNRYLAFSLESLKHPVPPRGISEGWDDQNAEMGKAWASITATEKEVFSSRVFQHFLKIPCGYDGDEDDEEAVGELTPDKIELYSPLYQNLVNLDKVAAFSAKGPESEGQTPGETYKQALKKILMLNSEVGILTYDVL
ncbi:hypothetical protein PTTG_09614 [Puccinia triticina 1-1 BBBD Race 1]|uniref:Uncharacterized protein n=1 Tax=Puccinia triticina (isolate 1-1 / race 1 (BBBD)) TaxID=630390 RepID=A0A180G2I7_PUCT1|nr:hypothetical protein PTTG_09614 [Puccinia triticina 1-1 BBBD Race 1]